MTLTPLEPLDVSRFSTEAIYGLDGVEVDLTDLVFYTITAGIDAWVTNKFVKKNASFGYAVAVLNPDELKLNPDDPYQTTWFVSGWGPELQRYIANAVRKMRAVLRTGKDTLTLRLEGKDEFRNPVESVTDDQFLWGDFPWGGAVIVKFGNLTIVVGVSCLREVEDDAIAKFIAGIIGQAILKVLDPAEFNKP